MTFSGLIGAVITTLRALPMHVYLGLAQPFRESRTAEPYREVRMATVISTQAHTATPLT